MNKILGYTILLLTLIIEGYSQTKVGVISDIDGNPFYGYYDPTDYNPERALKISHNTGEFQEGYYYKQEEKVHGLIKFENKRLYYKKNKDDYYESVSAEAINHAVLGVDSFFVVSKFYYKNKLRHRREFVQFMDTIGDITIAKHYHFKSELAADPTTIVTYLAKHKDSTTWDNFHMGRRFLGNIEKYFSDVPDVVEKVKKKRYSQEDMPNIIKMAKFYRRYQRNQAILYDQYWHETNDPKKAKFQAYIKKIEKSIWTIEYYENHNILYSIEYKSLSPMVKKGTLKSYYPNGKIRKIQSYKKNILVDAQIFNDKSEIIAQYQNVENDNDYDYHLEYYALKDSINENDTRNYYDTFDAKEYTFNFRDRELDQSFRKEKDQTIYQTTKNKEVLGINKLQKRLNKFAADSLYPKAIEANVEGYILLKVKVDYQGKIVEYNLLNNLHPELDQLVFDFAYTYFDYSKKPYFRFKLLKHKNPKAFKEFVIPVNFSVNRMYQRELSPFYYHHWHHQHHWNMHQQIHSPNFTPPRPAGF